MTDMRAAVTFRIAVLSALLGTIPAHAHHSFAMFDQKQCQSVEGTVKKLQWAYPHIWLWIVADGADHSPILWGFEGGDPATLAVQGWTGESLKKGDKTTVFFNPLIDGRKGGSLRQVVLPGGKTLSAQTSSGADDKYFKACAPSR
jgi:hypothetical protein